MKLNVYSMFDSASNAFTRPMYFVMDGEAIRAFQTEANRKESVVCMHPDQFTFMHIGVWDDSTGEFTSMPPRSFGTALQYKDSVGNDPAFNLAMDAISKKLDTLLAR